MNTLQTLVFPNLEVPAPDDLYARLDARCWPELARPCLRFEPGGLASLDTFYNGLTVAAWKKTADVRTLALELEGEGDFILTFGVHRRHQPTAYFAEHEIALAPGRPVATPIPAWQVLSDGILFFRLRSRAEGVLAGGAWVTPDEPPNDVRLGLVITHFNRQAQVRPAIDRIRRALLDRPDLQGRIDLTVVDNSRNLEVPEHPAIARIPNRNLGGTGGFVRGLLALVDGGRATHALFMDDDASCETESIARAFALLRHARDPKLAIAGALLRELAPWELFEKGARFDGQVRPLHGGLDVRRVDALIEAEQHRRHPDYGAWWFFAFPIAAVRRWPFPFFVRGDDIFFGLDNRFPITTLNGVACFGEDFSTKHGPLTAYLDARYHLVHALLSEKGTLRGIFWVASRLFMKSLTAYQYSSARAVTLALRHTLLGPDFYREHLDLQAVRSEIASWTPNEKMQPLERDRLDLRGPRNRRESRGRRLLRTFTLQGFLLPGFLLRDRTTVQDKTFHGRASAVFRYRRVLYEHGPSGTGFVAEFDRGRFYRELGSFLRALGTLLGQVPQLRRDFKRGHAEMTTLAFWRSVYGPPASAPGESVAASDAATPSSVATATASATATATATATAEA